jgi:hypothetical protein
MEIAVKKRMALTGVKRNENTSPKV